MRILATKLVLAAAMTLAAASAQAQTYDPNYPICLQVFGRAGNYIGCGYTSMAQCKLSASGRAPLRAARQVVEGDVIDPAPAHSKLGGARLA